MHFSDVKTAQADHRILEAIADRWSARAFADRDVSEPALRRVLEAARWAASAFNEQPWRFVLARRGVEENGQAWERLLGCLVPANQSWAKAAPVIGISFAKNAYAMTGAPNSHAWHDLGAAQANMAVQAAAEGLSLHLMAGIDRDAIAARLQPPEGFDAVAGFALGYPGDPAMLDDKFRTMETSPRARHPQSAFAFFGAWNKS